MIFMFILTILPPLTLNLGSYQLQLTSQQLSALGLVFIIEYRNKICFIKDDEGLANCQNYCRKYYNYIPSLPFKNAQHFNPATQLCEPKPFCQKKFGIYYDEKEKKCFDFFQGIYKQPIDAPQPEEKTKFLVNFICQHGKIINYNGRNDCQCDIGYTSYLEGGVGQNNYYLTFKKCDHAVPLSAYFPNFMKVYYDPDLDNKFPTSTTSNYWISLLSYYLRKLKYEIVTFFVPWEIQVTVISIPQENSLVQDNLLILVFLIVLILLLTIFHNCLNSVH